MYTGLPGDPVILLSVVNTKLRDFYPSLEALCEDMQADQKEITDKLKMIDYESDSGRYRGFVVPTADIVIWRLWKDFLFVPIRQNSYRSWKRRSSRRDCIMGRNIRLIRLRRCSGKWRQRCGVREQMYVSCSREEPIRMIY